MIDNQKVIQKIKLAIEVIDLELKEPNPKYKDISRPLLLQIRRDFQKMIISVNEMIYDENLIYSGMGRAVTDSFPFIKGDLFVEIILSAQHEYKRYAITHLQPSSKRKND
jgi:hypothetical protein